MVKRIKFEGKIHSFPDDATDEEINQMLGGEQPAPSLSSRIYGELSGAAQMPLGRSLKNIGQGAIDLGEFATNPAGPLMGYLAKKDIPFLSAAAKHWPQYPDSDVFGLGEQQPGDVVFQALTPVGPAAKSAQILGKSLAGASKAALSKAPQLAEKVGDAFPILKSTASKPYKKQMQILKEKDLLTGYKPNPADILEASTILKSPGMTIPHAAVDEAVAQALDGNFKPWFNLQSSVKSEGRRLSKKGGVHNTLGQKLYELGEKMHSEMGRAQASRGAPEAAKLMEQGQKRTALHYKINPVSKLASHALMAASPLPKWAVHLTKAIKK